MAFRLRDTEREQPAISTASLPDIVFILLFFFMVATVLRETTVLVDNQLPKATELTKIQDKDVVSYIYIGKPKNANDGTADRVQLNDKYMRSYEDIKLFVNNEKSKLPPFKQGKFIVSLKIDHKAKTGIKYDVTEELRKNFAYKINYATLRRDETY